MRHDIRILTVSEAAERLGVSDIRVRQLLAQGRIVGARKLGRDGAIPAPIEIEPPARPVGGQPKRG